MLNATEISPFSTFRNFIATLFLLGALFFSTVVNAQNKNPKVRIKPPGSTQPKDTIINKDETGQKDIYDVIGSLFKKHSTTTKAPDTISSNPIYSVVPAVGYTLQTKLAAVVAGNMAFRIRPEAKLSTISANVTYTQNKQFYVPVTSNISTIGNRFRLVGELRFYKYPQSTFGLGSCAPIANEDPMDYTYFRFYETALKKIKGDFYAGLGYNLDYHWNISHKGNINRTESDFAKYDTSRHTVSSGVNLTTLFDSRDNPINAQKGFYASLQLRKNFKAIGSQRNWSSVIIDLRKYFRLPGKSENILGFWSYNTLILSGKPPYLDLPSTGWDSYNNSGRGFIQGRYRGTKMIYMESEYRFKISSNGLLGGVLFANEEAFSKGPGSSLEAFQTGYGTGLRVKINKLSNTNLGVDYGFGTQGSKGLFITVGEMF